ncbi:MAG: thiol peroxidase [Candidatus Omnitrophota bacterium]
MKTVAFQGNPLTLVGRPVRIGSAAADFKVVSQELKDVTLSDFRGKIKIINSFPSLDTPVCDLQVKEFNKRALSLANEVVVIGISRDLPFAQKRFCQAHAIKNVVILSDYKTSSFGINYGLQIKELNLLARAVLVLDKNDIVRYVQIVAELTHAPDYEAVVNALSDVIKKPALAVEQGEPSQCKPCEGGTPPLPKETIERLLAQHRGWQLVDDKKINKEFIFKDFVEAKYFVDLIAVIAEEQGHHPTITIIYNKVKITLTTHAAAGLTQNDFIMSNLIDDLV